MGEALYELLLPHLDSPAASPSRPDGNKEDALLHTQPRLDDAVTAKYLNRLGTLPLSAINSSSEQNSLDQAAHSNLLSFQALAARSNAALVASSEHLAHLSSNLPQLSSQAAQLRDQIPTLDDHAVQFSEKYSRLNAGTNNTVPASVAMDRTASAMSGIAPSDGAHVLQRRKRAELLARNVERVSDILDLPMLLTSAITSSSSSSSSSSGTTSTTSASASAAAAAAASSNFASALDLHSLIKRLHLLYPDSPLLGSIYDQTEEAMQAMMANLTQNLRAGNVKLAGAMRIIGWLRRVAPELDAERNTCSDSRASADAGHREGSLGAYFLVCRLAMLTSMLNALEPMRDLADQETAARLRSTKTGPSTDTSTPTKKKTAQQRLASRETGASWSSGQQSERYLKRYLEIFREQSFAIVSMFRSIFPRTPDTTAPGTATAASAQDSSSSPSALSTFPAHLVTTFLLDTLRTYLPNVRDRATRESLLTQVLYCAGSMGRLGGDFSLLLVELGRGERAEGETGGKERSGGDPERSPRAETTTKPGAGGEVKVETAGEQADDTTAEKTATEKGQGEEPQPDGEGATAKTETAEPEKKRDEVKEADDVSVRMHEDEEDEYQEWIAMMKKHRVLAGRLEKMSAASR